MKTVFLASSMGLPLLDKNKEEKKLKANLERVGVSTKVCGSLSTACYPQGTCTKETLVQSYSLYDKVYTIDDSIILRALSVYGSKMLEGGYITVINNVKDKQPIYRDELNVRYKSVANGGKDGNACGPFDPGGKIDIVTNKCIKTNFLYVETSICYKKLVGSFKQGLLTKRGQLQSELNDALNDRVVSEIIKSNARQTDRLIWTGDYKSPVDDICHYDGLVKKTFNAIGAANNHAINFLFTGTLAADECFAVQAGGVFEEFAFDTNTVTTIGNIATFLTALTHPITGQALYTVAFDGVDEISVVSNFTTLAVEIDITTTDCNGATCKNTDSVVVTETEVVAFEVSDVPLTIPFVPITSANVLQQVELLYLKAAGEHPDLTTNDDFYIHVSPYIWACITAASLKLTGAFMGIDNATQNRTPFGLKVVEQPGLNQCNIMFGTRTSNIFFGTDLESDMMNTEQWIDKDCQEVRFRHESRQGVQVDRFSDVVCNLDGAPFTFQAPEPDDCTAVANC